MSADGVDLSVVMTWVDKHIAYQKVMAVCRLKLTRVHVQPCFYYAIFTVKCICELERNKKEMLARYISRSRLMFVLHQNEKFCEQIFR